VKTNEHTPVLSATEIFATHSSFRRYKAYADIIGFSRDEAKWPILTLSVAISSEPLNIRSKLLLRLMTDVFSMDSSIVANFSGKLLFFIMQLFN